MTGPWYVKEAWDRTYLMRHDLNPSTAQSECDRLNAEWEQAQVPVKVPQAVVKCKMTIIDEDVKQPGEPTITVQEIGMGWGAVLNGKYYVECFWEKTAKAIADEVTKKRRSAGYQWKLMGSGEVVSNKLVDAEWPKLPVKEDIKTVEVIKKGGGWHTVINGKYHAKCELKDTAETIKKDTIAGKPHKWHWHLPPDSKEINLRDFLNLKD